MIRARFKCPKCGKDISVKAESKQSLLNQVFKCPGCHRDTPFSQILGGASPTASDMHTHIVGAGSGMAAAAAAVGLGNEKTRIAQASPISIVVDGTGRRLPVAIGSHILGRDSLDSRATVKVASDPYMSRQHARLDIAREGNRLSCRISCLKTANPVIVNSTRLAEGQSYSLKPGDKVILGMTAFHLELNL